MSTGETIGSVLGLISFAVWVPCLIGWIKRGIVLPPYIHMLAGILTVASVATFLVLSIQGAVTLKIAAAFLLIPAPATYFGWLWMFGPEFDSHSHDD